MWLIFCKPKVTSEMACNRRADTNALVPVFESGFAATCPDPGVGTCANSLIDRSNDRVPKRGRRCFGEHRIQPPTDLRGCKAKLGAMHRSGCADADDGTMQGQVRR